MNDAEARELAGEHNVVRAARRILSFGPRAVVGEDFPEEHVRFFASRGIDLAGLVRQPGRTFRWKGRY